MEDMHDEITKIFENPTSLSPSFPANRLDPREKKLVFNFGGDGLNVAFVATCRDEENIGEWKWITDVESNDVCGTLTVSCGNRDFQYVEGLF